MQVRGTKTGLPTPACLPGGSAQPEVHTLAFSCPNLSVSPASHSPYSTFYNINILSELIFNPSAQRAAIRCQQKPEQD